MREYIFRGWSKFCQKWVYGSLIHWDDYCCILHKDVHPMDEPYLDEDIGTFDGKATPVVPESVGQYTGMKDKNGKKIFEGDVVDCWSEGVNAQGTVQQRKDGLWIIYPAWQKHIMWGLCPDEYSYTTVEVIDNAYENADLLEG